MAQLMKCKSCGFVIEERKVGDVCPACGVPRKMFEPFTDPVSPRRRVILGLDVHPIVVHFAVSFAVSAFAVAIFIVIFPMAFRQTATAVFRAFIGALPLILIATFFSGRYDKKIRFKKSKGPLLRTKTIVGIVFFCLAATAAVLTFAVGPFDLWVRLLDLALLAGCCVCAFILGRIGASLLCALFPG